MWRDGCVKAVRVASGVRVGVALASLTPLNLDKENYPYPTDTLTGSAIVVCKLFACRCCVCVCCGRHSHGAVWCVAIASTGEGVRRLAMRRT